MTAMTMPEILTKPWLRLVPAAPAVRLVVCAHGPLLPWWWCRGLPAPPILLRCVVVEQATTVSAASQRSPRLRLRSVVSADERRPFRRGRCACRPRRRGSRARRAEVSTAGTKRQSSTVRTTTWSGNEPGRTCQTCMPKRRWPTVEPVIDTSTMLRSAKRPSGRERRRSPARGVHADEPDDDELAQQPVDEDGAEPAQERRGGGPGLGVPLAAARRRTASRTRSGGARRGVGTTALYAASLAAAGGPPAALAWGTCPRPSACRAPHLTR